MSSPATLSAAAAGLMRDALYEITLISKVFRTVVVVPGHLDGETGAPELLARGMMARIQQLSEQITALSDLPDDEEFASIERVITTGSAA